MPKKYSLKTQQPIPNSKVKSDRAAFGGDDEGGINIESFGEAVGSIGAALSDKSKYRGASTGTAIGTTVGSIADAFVPGLGKVAGKVLGTVGGLIGGASDQKKYERDFDNWQSRQFGKLDMALNTNPYGTDEIMFAEDGGMVEEGSDQEEPEMQMVNIEKGEILIDPVTLDVVREYSNPHRYKPHAKRPMDEPVGNFTFIEPGKVVIPKKYANRFKEGDRLTKGSIILEILKDQRNNPPATVSAPGSAAVPQAGKGYGVVEDPKPVTGIAAKTPRTSLMIDLLNPAKRGDILPVPATTTAGAAGSPVGVGKPAERPLVPFPGRTSYVPDFKEKKSVIGELEGPSFGQDALDANLKTGSTNPYSFVNKPSAVDLPSGTYWNEAPKVKISGKTVSGKVPGKGINMVAAARAVNVIPTALGLGFAMENDPYLQYDEPDFRESEAYLQAIPDKPVIEASRRAIHGSKRALNQMINNIVGPSTRAEVAVNHAASVDAEGRLIQDATNSVLEARTRKLTALGQLSGNKANARYNAKQAFRESLRKDRANRQTMIQAGTSELARNFSKSVIDDEQIKTWNSVLEFVKLNPGSKVPIMDSGEFAAKVFELFNQKKAEAAVTKSAT